MRAGKLLVVGIGFALTVAACSSGTTAATDAGSGADEPQAQETTVSVVASPAETSDETSADLSKDTSAITASEQNNATVAIGVGGQTFTEDLAGDLEVTCTTYGSERSTASIGVFLEGERLSVSARTSEDGVDVGEYEADLGVFSLDDEIDALLGGLRDGAGTLELDRVVEIAPDVLGDLWLFEGTISGELADAGPEGSVEATFACIGNVSWSAG